MNEAPGGVQDRALPLLRDQQPAHDHSDAGPRVVRSSHGHRDALVRRVLALADSVALIGALAISGAAAHQSAIGGHLLWGALTIPLWVSLFKLYLLYDRDMKRVSHTTVDDAPWVFHAVLVGALLLWLWFSVVPAEKMILSESMVFGATAILLVLICRSVVRSAMTRRLAPERVLLVDPDQELMELLVRKMSQHPEYGLRPVGVLSTNGHARADSLALPRLGSPAELSAIVVEHAIDRIVISRPGASESEQLELLRNCRDLSLKVSVLPQLFETMGPSMEVDDVEGITLLGLHPPVLSRSSRFLKRVMDVAGSAVLLILMTPVIALVAIAVKLDSRGPIFFGQVRIGKNDRRFRLLKFRTMVADAEARAADLRHLSKDEGWLHLEHDPRITRMGRFLRNTSLDELPQLLNVLRGEMSLVGPRPLIESEDRLIDGWGRRRLQLTPGITGSWQVLGRTSIPFEEMVKLDYLYVTNWSLWTDVRLILRTLPAVLTRRGVN